MEEVNNNNEREATTQESEDAEIRSNSAYLVVEDGEQLRTQVEEANARAQTQISLVARQVTLLSNLTYSYMRLITPIVSAFVFMIVAKILLQKFWEGAVSSVIVGILIATVCVEAPSFYYALIKYVQFCNTDWTKQDIEKHDTSPNTLETEHVSPVGAKGRDSQTAGDVATVGSEDDPAYDTSDSSLNENNNNGAVPTTATYTRPNMPIY